MSHSQIINGLDIGTSKITAIVGQFFHQENRLNVVAVASTPSTGFRKGQIVDIEQASSSLTKCIESAERMAGFPINRAHVAITAPHLESLNSRGVVAVSNPDNEISSVDIDRAIESAKAVTLPAGKEIIHVIPRIFTVDGQDGIIDPVGMSGVRLEVDTHLIIASTPALKNLKKCLDDVGIQLESLVFSGLSTAKIALTDTEKELGAALVDIGASATTVTIFFQGSPVYSTVIPVGSANITNDLAIGLRFPLEDAEKIKTKFDQVAGDNKFGDEVDVSAFEINSDDKRKISLLTTANGIIKPRIEEIFNLVHQSLQSSGFVSSIPAGVILTGGGSLLAAAREICPKIIPLPTRLAQTPKIGGIVDDILNPCYHSSLGLLFYLLQSKPPSARNTSKNKPRFHGLLDRIKNLIEPLLP